MSVENFAGHGDGDQPSIIYAFDGGDEIREVVRSGYGEIGHSPGDVINRDSTRSTPTERLPELEIPGQRGLQRDDCGEDLPAFACEECGFPKYIGRTCGSPHCSRCWASAVKDKTIRSSGKLEGFRRKLYAKYSGNFDIDFNHVVASLPDFLVDSDTPIKRALLVLKTLLEKKWQIEGFLSIYHPYRIKKKYRADQYEHDGEPGEGDMTWKDVLTSDDPMQFLKFEPHFHLFFPAKRKSFDYLTAESVYEESGWLFHRITKGEDSNVSVEDLDDLVHQITYCFSHAGVNDRNADRSELTSRMKGDLHNCYIPDGVEEKCLASFCDASPKLLGVKFANVSNATCDAEISTQNTGETPENTDSASSESDKSHNHQCECGDCTERHDHDRPITEVWDTENIKSGSTLGGSSAGPAVAGQQQTPPAPRDTWSSFGGSSSSSASEAAATTTRTAPPQPVEDSSDNKGEDSPETPISDDRQQCGGSLTPINEAADLLEDDEWCRTAAYVAALRTAVEEWERRTGGSEDLPWLDDCDGPDDDDETSVILDR